MSKLRRIFLGSNASSSNEFHEGATHCVVVLDQPSANELLRIERETADYLNRLNGAEETLKPTVEIGQTPVDFVFIRPKGDRGDEFVEAMGDFGEFVSLPQRPRIDWRKAGEPDSVECRALEIHVGDGIGFRALCRHSETWLTSEMLSLADIRRIAEGQPVETD